MKRTLTLVLAAAALSVSACSTASPGGTPPPASSSAPASPSAEAAINVVASTNVYGSVAEIIGGDAVTVTSIIDNPDKDPHEYEADAQTQLALSKAQIVIENGGGYDDFVDTMLKAAPTQPTLINVADLSGYDQEPAEGEFNEHMWYDFPTMAKLATQLGTDLSAAAPSKADTIKANVSDFTAKLEALEQQEDAIKAAHSGEGVAITEPVPLYLLDAAGLENKTPDEFSEAIEEDSDVAPAVLQETIALFNTKQVKLLAYNEQTTGPQTEAVLAAAEKNDIPVVPVAETLPDGETYLSWMGKNVEALSGALSG